MKKLLLILISDQQMFGNQREHIAQNEEVITDSDFWSAS
jgi:hypothetical protein